MQPAYIGIDVAIAKGKHLPIAVCVVQQGRLIPKLLRRIALSPPRGDGNAAALDQRAVQQFARAALQYVVLACKALRLEPARVGIDAPSAPRSTGLPRRSAEVALDRAGISCFGTPSAFQFEAIRTKVADYLARGGREDRMPHANQLWMLAGFAIFEEFSRLAPCIEVFPQATIRAVGVGLAHKSQTGAVEKQLGAVSTHTGWPIGDNAKAALGEIAWGQSHDQLDAYLSAWVASLDESKRECFGMPPSDAIWVQRLPGPELPVTTLPQTEAKLSFPGTPTVSSRSPLLVCPGCGRKEFKRWPWGWDGHAAHVCTALSGKTPMERKAEYRHLFAAYF